MRSLLLGLMMFGVIQSVPKVSLTLKDSTVKSAIAAVAKQTKMRVIYDDAVSRVTKRVSIDVKDADVMEALAMVLKGTRLEAKIASDGETIMVGPVVNAPRVVPDSQTGRITGRVVDSATGKGISGVTVTIVGINVSTVTKTDGTFTLKNVPLGDQSINYKLFGYRALTRAITVVGGRSTTVRVVMVTVPTQLSGVVTTATGTQRKLEVGNDITVINVDSVMRTAPIATVTDLLETRVPGLTVMRSSGVPGAPSRIRIRGLGGGLLAGQEGAPTNDPIVVVDGIRIHASQSGVGDQNLAAGANYPPPSPIDQIDPNSIEKIEVLKGPSASALYGSDAANGVIIITTKRGRAGSTQWSATGNTSVTYFPGLYAKPGFYAFCHSIGGTFNFGPAKTCADNETGAIQFGIVNFIIDSVRRFQALNEPRLTAFGTGTGNNVSSTVTGGTQSVTYSLTGSMWSEVGLLQVPPLYQDLFRQLYDSAMPRWMRRPNLLQKKAANASLIVEPRRGLRVTLTSRLTNQRQRQSSAQLQLAALARMYIDTVGLGPTDLGRYTQKVTSDGLVFDQAVAANWDLWSFLPLTGTAGFSRANQDQTSFSARGITGRNVRDTVGFYSGASQMTNTVTAQLNGTLFPGRRVSVAIGTNLTDVSRRQITYIADSLPPGVTNPTRVDRTTPGAYTTSTGGWFVEPRLNLNSRFFFNPGFRFDGNSVSGNRSGIGGGLWSLFPKLNFSWIALDAQGGTPYWGFLSLLRPRLGVGVAGVQPAPGWQLRLMRAITNLSNGLEDSGLMLSTIGNTQLRPERTREIEGGFDADLWNGRLSVTVTQFVKMRFDAIEQIPIPLSIYGDGIQQYRNIGRVRNLGTELSLDAIILENSHVRWSVAMSISKYTNTLTALNSEQPYINLGDGTRLVPGYPLFSRWSRPILGYGPPSIDGRWLAKSDVIVGDSAVYMGQQAPNFELPMSTSVSLFNGQVSLNAIFQYKDGLTQMGNATQFRNVSGLNPDVTLAEQAAALMACRPGAPDAGWSCTNYGLIQTVSSLRFNSLSIGYNIPRSVSKRFRIPSVTFAVQGSNLGLWTSYRGKDPDVNSTTLGDVTKDSGQLPSPRLWRLQVSLRN